LIEEKKNAEIVVMSYGVDNLKATEALPKEKVFNNDNIKIYS
jgi:hypothetical protein